MTTDLANRPTNGHAPTVAAFDPATIDLIRRTVARDANDRQLELFLYTAHARGLDPLLGQIHAVVRKGNLAIQVGIDGLRLIAARTQTYLGNEEPVFIEGEQYPRKATVTVWRLVAGHRCAFTDSAYWAEFYPGDGADGFMWRKLPHVMLGKVAESRALRKAFPNETSGLYSDDEMHQADRPAVAAPAPVLHRVGAPPQTPPYRPRDDPAAPPVVVQPARIPSREVPAGKRWSEADLRYFWGNLGSLEPKVTSDELHAILGVDSLHDWPDLDTALGAVFAARQAGMVEVVAEDDPPHFDTFPHPEGSIEAEWERYTRVEQAAAAWNQQYPEQPIRYADPPRDAPAPQVRAYADGLERRLAKLGVGS